MSKFQLNQYVFIQGLNKYGRVCNIDTTLQAGLYVMLNEGGSIMVFTHEGKFTNDIYLVECDENVLAHPNYQNVDQAILNLNVVADYLADVDLQMAHDVLNDVFKRIRHDYVNKLTEKCKNIKVE